MKRKVIIGSIITVFLSIFAYYSLTQIVPQEIENAPEWMPLHLAMEQAAEEDRLVMIDIYEVGCQFCRKMDRETYPAPSVRSVLDRAYFPVKINGNSENKMLFNGEEITERDFASRMGVTAFPFTVIMDADGNVIDSRRGYQDIVGFTRFLNSAVEKSNLSVSGI
ncbi:MAG: thioredoxin fold domain-containing protein [Balneolaceae bacterium]